MDLDSSWPSPASTSGEANTNTTQIRFEKLSNTICKAQEYFGKLASTNFRPSDYHLLTGKAVFELLLFNVAQLSLAIEINT